MVIYMKRIMLILAMLCLGGIGSVFGAQTAANQTCGSEAGANGSTTYIFLQEGMNGSFIKDASGNYTLTLKEVVPYTVFFSDRPARNAGFIEMDRFLKGFGFDIINPPNALVMIKGGKEESDAIVVELTSPSYNKTNSTLTYVAKVIDNYVFKSEWPKDLLSRVDKAIPEHFGRVAIVIDNKAKLSCSDSTADCGNENKVCGSISTGCCWSWLGGQCEACHSAATYDAECKAKYGNNCGYLNENHCLY
jgi:hypothetical protein